MDTQWLELAKLLKEDEYNYLPHTRIYQRCKYGGWKIYPPPYWWDFTKLDDEWTACKGTEGFITGRWKIK